MLVGSSNVGKSNIISRYANNEFGKVDATVGVEFRRRSVSKDGHSFSLLLWDTAGQERYR